MVKLWPVLVCCLPGLYAIAQHPADTIPLGGNAWRHKIHVGSSVGDSTGGYIDNNGIGGWTDSTIFFTVWLRTSVSGDLRVWINAKVPRGGSRVSIMAGKPARAVELDLKGDTFKAYDAGVFHFDDTGYHVIRLRGIRRGGPVFAEVPALIVRGVPVQGSPVQGSPVQGSPVDTRLAYVPNNEGNFFHWGRRGPSVHLNYPLPPDFDACWFYNEVTVPAGQDVQGSYFMACGFAHGYFGMQVNSPTERHILFSVWSPYETDNPAAIPDSQQIKMLSKGEGVHTGEFGNEGAGGQSYLNFPWKAGRTYRFLLHAQRTNQAHIVYTAWWFAPEEGHWRQIASFSRPETFDDLTGLYSFLENFEPEMGDHRRYGEFSHAWVADSAGHWASLNRARFTVDNTGRKGYRMDFGGGVHGKSFYLENDGFFNKYTSPGIWLDRPADAGDKGPDIKLPK